MTEKKPKMITPNVGDTVWSQICKVFGEPVIEVTEDGFICKPSGLWEGTSEDWEITRVAD